MNTTRIYMIFHHTKKNDLLRLVRIVILLLYIFFLFFRTWRIFHLQILTKPWRENLFLSGFFLPPPFLIQNVIHPVIFMNRGIHIRNIVHLIRPLSFYYFQYIAGKGSANEMDDWFYFSLRTDLNSSSPPKKRRLHGSHVIVLVLHLYTFVQKLP